MSQGGNRQRIGILGGTLDPIHVGHVETALRARQAVRLSSVIIMPARVPPHRQRGPAASPFHRFAMAALAVNGIDDMWASDEELVSDGPSYTALTLERFHGRGVAPSEIFFITGADAFAEIETWYRYPHVLELANFVVISRPGLSAVASVDRIPELRKRVMPMAVEVPVSAPPSVFLVDASTPDVSSTEVRRRLRAGESVHGLVPESVERHIRQHRLYGLDQMNHVQ